MIYVYRCPDCEHTEEITHSMLSTMLYSCVHCFETMRKVPQIPQLITEPFHLKEQNRPPEQSSLDRLARMKADEKVYEASYKQSAPEGGASMAELAQKMGVPLG